MHSTSALSSGMPTGASAPAIPILRAWRSRRGCYRIVLELTHRSQARNTCVRAREVARRADHRRQMGWWGVCPRGRRAQLTSGRQHGRPAAEGRPAISAVAVPRPADEGRAQEQHLPRLGPAFAPRALCRAAVRCWSVARQLTGCRSRRQAGRSCDGRTCVELCGLWRGRKERCQLCFSSDVLLARWPDPGQRALERITFRCLAPSLTRVQGYNHFVNSKVRSLRLIPRLTRLQEGHKQGRVSRLSTALLTYCRYAA